jgi:hypothetical protein
MHRPLVPVLFAVVAAVLAGALVWLGPGGVRATGPSTAEPVARPRASASPLARPSLPTQPRALRVLHAWDERRAAAYSSGSVRLLRTLYAPGSAAGSDVRLLRRYLGRGLRVTGMRMQLLALTVLDRRPGLLRLRVTDRLYGATAVGVGGRRVRLPRDQASVRVLELRKVRRSWRMVTVTVAGRR